MGNTISAVANFAGAALGLVIMAAALMDSRKQQQRRHRELAQAKAAREAYLAAQRDSWTDMLRQIADVDDAQEEAEEA